MKSYRHPDLERFNAESRFYGWCALIIAVCGCTTIGLYAAEAHPAATAADWAKDPAAAAAAAAEAAKHTAGMGATFWTAVLGGALTLVGVMRQYGHLLPFVGPWWKFAMDTVWTIGQTKDARLTDKAKENVANAAALACSFIRLTRKDAPDAWAKVPESIRISLEALEKAECP